MQKYPARRTTTTCKGGCQTGYSSKRLSLRVSVARSGKVTLRWATVPVDSVVLKYFGLGSLEGCDVAIVAM